MMQIKIYEKLENLTFIFKVKTVDRLVKANKKNGRLKYLFKVIIIS